jgi:ferredoxin
MTPEIFYFSGTGNSLFLARGLAERLEARITPIGNLIGEGSVVPEGRIVGIVFPVYYASLPVIVKEFAAKLEGIEGCYIFAVANYGGAAGDSLRILRRIIQSKGGKLMGSYGIHMPQNAFRKFWENPERISSKAERKLDTIAENAKAGRRGRFLGSWLTNALIEPLNLILSPLSKRGLVQLTGASNDESMDDLIRMAGRSFAVGEECTGCGICERVCPVNNIKLVDGRPKWLDHCENCLACYNFCPSETIGDGVVDGDYRYHHPDVTAAQMIESRAARDRTR